jgi:hypothetical protein
MNGAALPCRLVSCICWGWDAVILSTILKQRGSFKYPFSNISRFICRAKISGLKKATYILFKNCNIKAVKTLSVHLISDLMFIFAEKVYPDNIPW